MQTTYKLSGLTCDACSYKVKYLFGQLNGVNTVDISADRQIATIDSVLPIPLGILADTLKDTKYKVAFDGPTNMAAPKTLPDTKSWFSTYRPLLLVFFYITLVSGLAAYQVGHFEAMAFMRYFMAGFFLVFSFFKLLDLKGFAESYRMYDLVAKYIKPYGIVYPFLELGLGIAYCLDIAPFITNLFALVLMSVSLVGVVESVMNKRKIRCACLGTGFNLPMSTVTIIEDTLMIVMAGISLFAH